MKYSEMTPEQIEKRKDYFKKYHSIWYQRNKERLKPIRKYYAETHRRDSVKRTQRYVAKHPERVKSYNHLYQRDIGGRWRTHRFGALRKNLVMTLTKDDFTRLISAPCRYCGFTDGFIGVDRVDNSKGYTLDNSVPCCKTCNYMKKNLSVKDFLYHISKIHDHQKLNN